MKFKTNGKINDIYGSNTNNQVFLCGEFSKIGNDISANKLAMIDNNFKYYGTEFFKMENFDSNIFDNYKINTVISFANKVVVGGFFWEIGGIKANHIAMFDLDTKQWEYLGDPSNNGVNAEVCGIKYFDNKLVIGGLFTVANNRAPTSDVIFPEIAANYVAIYDLLEKKWYSLSDSTSPNGGGVIGNVYCFDIIENSDNFEIYVGGCFSGVFKIGSPNIVNNTYLLAKFTLRSLINNNLNNWSAVLNLQNLFQNNINFVPKINVINSTKGLIGGKFTGKPQVLTNNNNTNNVYNIFQYTQNSITRIGSPIYNYEDFTILNDCKCSSVKDILFYTENKAFIAGNFNRVQTYSYLAKFDNITKNVSALEDSNDKPNFPVNALAWVDNCYEELCQNNSQNDNYEDKARVGRLFIGNNCNTDKKLIYNVPLENIVLNESWSYSFYDILDNAQLNSVSLKNYLNECVFGKNSFQYSYYDSDIKPYLRAKYYCFIQNNFNRVEFVEYYIKRLDSLIQIYAQSFEEKCEYITFCLMNSDIGIDLGDLNNPPHVCYFTCNNNENIFVKIKDITYKLEYSDNGGILRKFSYDNQHAGVGEQIIFELSTNELVKIEGVGSVLAEFYCLTRNTKILTPNGYISIYELKNGDIVITDDNRKVKIQNIIKEKYPPIKLLKPYLIEKNSIGLNYPPEDIELSGGHLIKYQNKWICPKLSKSFKQIETNEDIEYYHIELENYEKDNLVINNGCIVESYAGESEYNRIIYNNRLKNKKNKNIHK